MPVTGIAKHDDQRTITITAEFPAPPERVWAVYADPRQLERVWGPPTHPATFVDHDLTAGGVCRYFMTSPEGEKFGGWPGTKEWVYGKGWLDRFMATIGGLVTRGEVLLSRLDDALDTVPSGGLAYLPTAQRCRHDGTGRHSASDRVRGTFVVGAGNPSRIRIDDRRQWPPGDLRAVSRRPQSFAADGSDRLCGG